MKNVVHIYRTSSSGTSTLGRKISDELGYKFMDTDDLEKNFNTVHSLMNSVIEEL